MLEAGVLVNQQEGAEVSFPEGTIEFCWMEQIQIQAWSPLAKGVFTGREPENQPESVRLTAALVREMAERKGTAPEAIVLAWLMRHPAGIQPVLGTIRPERIQASAEALQVSLSREEWYSLYVSSRGRKMP